ncbi:uncharacterized protein K444DRAFT_660989 [Hyaloscypha bicolor E]|uniref:BTB domain-containing protein n=1 Tax=Hyaloscypha bicolor E TaxID=1095630 RepID=A0A2J6TKI0_9HELO|nr:uncharacterized protein K444DRAFT_660989 [Hyaloscypha bicolor E]PMD63524.1 hypothetical protein K444DRAFT_660989 [Hyaloscypha bicolor E]
MSSSASASNSAPGAVKDTSSNPLPSATKVSSSTAKTPLNFSSPEAQSFVTIHCKGAVQPFRTNKNVITHYSPFFSAAYNGVFKEGKTQSMSFEDVEAPIFGFFNNWLYTQKVVNEDGNRLQLIEYAKLWSLSQRFLMPDLQAILLKETENTLPSSDAKSGSTLKDFQQYVYLVVDQQEDSDLKKVAIKKTLSSVNRNNIDAVMNNIPEELNSTLQPFMTIISMVLMEYNMNGKVASSLLLKANCAASNNSADKQAAHITHHTSAMICHYSPFFSAAFNGEFIEITTERFLILELKNEVVDEIYASFGSNSNCIDFREFA